MCCPYLRTGCSKTSPFFKALYFLENMVTVRQQKGLKYQGVLDKLRDCTTALGVGRGVKCYIHFLEKKKKQDPPRRYQKHCTTLFPQ